MSTSHYFLQPLTNSCSLILQVLSENVPHENVPHTETKTCSYISPKSPRQQKTNQRMTSPQVHHNVAAKTKRFRVQCLGQKNNMLFLRRHVYNLQIPVGDSLPKEVKMDINELTIGSSHRVVRQAYPPLLSFITVVHPTLRSGKMRLQTYRMKTVSRIPVAIATYSAPLVHIVMLFCVLQ